MPEKSARSAASLRIGLLGWGNIHEAADGAGGAIQFDFIAIVEPVEEVRNRNYCWNLQLTRHNRRVREQTATRHKQSTGRGEQNNPTRIGTAGHQDATRS